MRICFVTGNFPYKGYMWGGMEANLYHLAHNLVERGHEVRVISKIPKPLINKVPTFQRDSLIVERFPNKHGLFLTYLKVHKRLKRIEADIVDTHAATLGTFTLFTGHKNILTLTESQLYERRDSWFWKNYYNFVCERADGLIANTNALAKIAKKKFEISRKVTVVPYGVDTKKFKPLKVKKLKNTVLVSRRLENGSGVENAIKAIPLLKNVKLHILGEGPKKEYYKQLVRKLGVGKRVKFLERVKHEKMPKLLNKYSLFLVPSTTYTGLVSSIEAMACGLPLIVSKVPGLKELVNNENGYIINSNPKEIANVLERVIGNDKLLDELGENSRKYSLKFDWERVVKRVLSVYKKTLNR